MNRGYLYALVAASLWGCLDILAKILLQEGVSPIVMATIRSAVAFIGGFAALLVFKKVAPRFSIRTLLLLLFNGLIGIALFYFLLFYTIHISNVITAVFLLYSAPIFVTIFGRVIFGESLDKGKMIGLVFSVGGIGLLLGAYDPENLKISISAIATGLGSGVSFACMSILTKKATSELDSMTVAAWSYGFGSLFLFIFSYQELGTQTYDLWIWGALIVMGLFMTLGALYFYIKSLKFIEASRASITSTAEVLVATCLSLLWLNESMDLLQAMGGISMLFGIILVQVKGGKAKP
jgi:drug/metabolite transporter (DMT)-like permease